MEKQKIAAGAIRSAVCQEWSWLAESASLRKRTVTPPFACSGGSEFLHAGCGYLTIGVPRKRARRVPVIRNAFAARPVKNDIAGIRHMPNIQNETVRVG